MVVDANANPVKGLTQSDCTLSSLTEGVTVDQNIAIPVQGDLNAPNFYLRVGVSGNATSHIGSLEVPVETIKLPATQTAGHNSSADRVPANTL